MHTYVEHFLLLIRSWLHCNFAVRMWMRIFDTQPFHICWFNKTLSLKHAFICTCTLFFVWILCLMMSSGPEFHFYYYSNCFIACCVVKCVLLTFSIFHSWFIITNYIQLFSMPSPHAFCKRKFQLWVGKLRTTWNVYLNHIETKKTNENSF